MQPVSFGAMLRVVDGRKDDASFYNPQQVSRVYKNILNETVMVTAEPSGEFPTIHTFKYCTPELLVEKLHKAQQTTDKPYIDLFV